ncbi:hypothetical protein KEM52_001098 [Ascosphaera acerosa]|nr:hypothetical protein KEM52_001098 [Ascosphaera acerosa]
MGRPAAAAAGGATRLTARRSRLSPTITIDEQDHRGGSIAADDDDHADGNGTGNDNENENDNDDYNDPHDHDTDHDTSGRNNARASTSADSLSANTAAGVLPLPHSKQQQQQQQDDPASRNRRRISRVQTKTVPVRTVDAGEIKLEVWVEEAKNKFEELDRIFAEHPT